MARDQAGYFRKLRTTVRERVVEEVWRGALARYHHDKPRVIAIGGSVGKTSTKEAIALVLEQSSRSVVKTHGNMGTDTGMPLSLLGKTAPPNGVKEWWKIVKQARSPITTTGTEGAYYVLEYSSDASGDTTFLTSRIAPDIVVLTTIIPVHMESYRTEEAMIEETLSLVDAVPEGGMVIANADDPVQRKALTRQRLGRRSIIWYGIERIMPKRVGVWATNPELKTHGLHFTLGFIANSSVDPLTQQSHRFTIHSKVVGDHQLYPLLAAAAVSWIEQLPVSKLKHALQMYDVPPGRGKLIAGKKNMTIIDDTANAASPEAMKVGLALLERYAHDRRRVAILGTMNELGDFAEQAHREVGREVAKRADFFIAVGKYAEIMVSEAKTAGMTSLQVLSFATPEQVIERVEQIVRAKDVVYIKASQGGMFLERVVKRLMAKPEQANELLVRQATFWDRHHSSS